MTKRNQRNRRHGTNELVSSENLPRKKGHLSPAMNGSSEPEYTIIDLVRSVDRLHFGKNRERKDSVLWADVKKHYKKNTGRVLSTEVFNKLAGLNGVSRKDIITGPLAGLLVAEDPAALVLHFKYDATKGDPLINHRFYLEMAGAKTSVHHANGRGGGATVSPRLADVTNRVSPSRSSRSETASSTSSLSPTCISSISTDPDTEALSPISAASPLSAFSAPVSPQSCDFVTASEEFAAAAAGEDGASNAATAATSDTSFLTARTSPITSDWESSPSREGDNTSPRTPSDRSANDPLNSSDQEKTMDLFNLSDNVTESTADGNEILVDMDRSAKEEKEDKKEECEVDGKMEVREEEKMKEEEEGVKEEEEIKKVVDDESDKENHVEPQSVQHVQQTQQQHAAAKPVEAVAATADDAFVVDEDDVPEATEEEVVADTTIEDEQNMEEEEERHAEEKEEDEEMAEPQSVQQTQQQTAAAKPAETIAEEEKKKDEEEDGVKEERREEKVLQQMAAGDGPVAEEVPPSDAVVVVDDSTSASSPAITSSSDEAILTVIERVAVTREQPAATVVPEPNTVPEDTVEEEETKEEEVMEDEKAEDEKEHLEQLAAGDVPGAPVLADLQQLQPKEEEEPAKTPITVDDAVAVDEKEDKKEEVIEETVECKAAMPVEEQQPPAVEEQKNEMEKEMKEDTVEEEEVKVEEIAVPVAKTMEESLSDDTVSSATEEPTATTMVPAHAVEEAAMAAGAAPSPVLTPPPPPAHEPMETISLNSISSSSSEGRHIDFAPSPTSDDVDMHDVLTDGPIRDDRLPSVTAPITLQPKPTKEPEEKEVITTQPVVDEADAAPRPLFSAASAVASPKNEDEENEAVSPDSLALRRAAPAKKFPCCTIV